jgi:uncharacterized membrane protein
LFVVLLIIISSATAVFAHAQEPVVRAVLFFSPTCANCHIVMEEVIPPLADQYGEQLDVVGIDVSFDAGINLYESAVTQFNIPDDRYGVPTLIIGDVVLVGSDEIPRQLPGIIERGLSEGGIDWPAIPGLKAILDAQPQTSDSTGPSAAPVNNVEPNGPVFLTKFMYDPIANSIAVLVLIGMVASVIVVGISFIKGTENKYLKWPDWLVPVLAIIGIGVSLYLTYVEVTRSDAICGPVGDCNSVQESPYAYLFGVLPVGLMGALGYGAILVCWALQRLRPTSWKKYTTLAIWGMAVFGVLFSIYLTFLEPFVIGATCAWCIISAIVITLIMLASTEPAKDVLRENELDFDNLEVDESSLDAENLAAQEDCV